MDSLGKKLLITGKGRCNITSSLPIEDFIQNVPGNGMFLYSSFNNFTNKDIIKMLEEEGLKVKEERGHRIFPITDSSKDVLNVLVRLLKRSNVKIETNAKVEKILTENEKIVGVQAVIDGKVRTINADKVILATGGMSYPVTGSNGDGYELAKELGHTITKIKPSLIPLTAQRESLEICKELQGLSLINVSIKLIDTQKNKIIYDDFGEMLFTHWGVSGPIILSGSAHLLRYKNVEELLKEGKIEISINLKPALTEEKLENRIKFLGAKKNPFPYMNIADYIILTSDYEGFPVTYLEAITLQKPLITTIDVSDDKINIGKDYASIISKEEQEMVKQVKEILKENKKPKKIDIEKIQSTRMDDFEKLFDGVI